MEKKKTALITVRLSDDVTEYLEKLSLGTGKKVSTLIREMILEYKLKN